MIANLDVNQLREFGKARYYATKTFWDNYKWVHSPCFRAMDYLPLEPEGPKKKIYTQRYHTENGLKAIEEKEINDGRAQLEHAIPCNYFNKLIIKDNVDLETFLNAYDNLTGVVIDKKKDKFVKGIENKMPKEFYDKRTLAYGNKFARYMVSNIKVIDRLTNLEVDYKSYKGSTYVRG